MSKDQGFPPERVVGIDVYRGLVMFLMMAEVLRLSEMANRFPESSFWSFLAYHQTHVEWVGCSLHDLIQPSFSFLVGVSLPFSIASRRARGQTNRALLGHAIWRSLVLILLGIFLRSTHRQQTYFTFEDTLSQIGLGYVPLVLFGLIGVGWRWVGLLLILLGYGAAFALYPLPAESFDLTSVGVPPDWPHNAVGWMAHWNKNTNLAWAFDQWFLNLFPRESPFVYNGGGYATLSFLPTLGTMLLGLIAGEWLKQPTRPATKLGQLAVAGGIGLALGWAADHFGLCPNVKRIWTPTWTIFSGGWCFLLLALFYGICDVAGAKTWSFPLRVIGANSIAAYCMAHLIEHFIVESYRIHLGQDVFARFGDVYEPMVQGIAVLATYWLILLWMERRAIFLRI